jgi:hypothetical protein
MLCLLLPHDATGCSRAKFFAARLGGGQRKWSRIQITTRIFAQLLGRNKTTFFDGII